MPLMMTTVAIAGLSSGKMMRRKIVKWFAPSSVAASSSEIGIERMNCTKM